MIPVLSQSGTLAIVPNVARNSKKVNLLITGLLMANSTAHPVENQNTGNSYPQPLMKQFTMALAILWHNLFCFT